MHYIPLAWCTLDASGFASAKIMPPELAQRGPRVAMLPDPNGPVIVPLWKEG